MPPTDLIDSFLEIMTVADTDVPSAKPAPAREWTRERLGEGAEAAVRAQGAELEEQPTAREKFAQASAAVSAKDDEAFAYGLVSTLTDTGLAKDPAAHQYPVARRSWQSGI